MGAGLRKPHLKDVDILSAQTVARTKISIQQLKVGIVGDAEPKWTAWQWSKRLYGVMIVKTF